MNNHKSLKILAISILHSNVSPCSKYLRVSPFYRTCSCFLLRLSSGRGIEEAPVEESPGFYQVKTGDIKNRLLLNLLRIGTNLWKNQKQNTRRSSILFGHPIPIPFIPFKKFQPEESTFQPPSGALHLEVPGPFSVPRRWRKKHMGVPGSTWPQGRSWD